MSNLNLPFYKSFQGYLILFFLSFCVSANSCSDSSSYTGRVIELDFRNIEEIKDQAWIEVDGIRYTHYQNFQESYKDGNSLPASKTLYYIVKSDSIRVPRYNPNSDFSLAISLGNFIDLTHSEKDSTLARVKLNQRFLMYTFGTLILQRPDSSKFTIRTSPDYPVKIDVLH